MTSLHNIGERVRTACVWEATARKLGNVHPNAEFQDTTYTDFVLSAAAIAPAFSCPGVREVGSTILKAVSATRQAVGKNTNLGMILLLAPLAAVDPEKPLRDGVREVLAGLTIEDARYAFEAIRLAKPGGLGEAPREDVRQEPRLTLLEAMTLAAERDRIARQYATGFADVFYIGLPMFLQGLERFGCIEAAILHSQLHWLARFPDSLIARKNGLAVAESVRRMAAEVLSTGGIETTAGRRAAAEFDRHLRSDGNKLNPGTTADLIAACLFAAMRENEGVAGTGFAWDATDWLALSARP